mmetsp:Transcript_13067/g.45696  ORF Transcript_13067/g.45696 Transcript_13067/m.45696 type:complete len:92 (+) Transcript_13067:872-1147(+)
MAMVRAHRRHDAVRRAAWWLVLSEAMDAKTRVGDRVAAAVLDAPLTVVDRPAAAARDGCGGTGTTAAARTATLRDAARGGDTVTVLVGSST